VARVQLCEVCGPRPEAERRKLDVEFTAAEGGRRASIGIHEASPMLRKDVPEFARARVAERHAASFRASGRIEGVLSLDGLRSENGAAGALLTKLDEPLLQGIRELARGVSVFELDGPDSDRTRIGEFGDVGLVRARCPRSSQVSPAYPGEGPAVVFGSPEQEARPGVRGFDEAGGHRVRDRVDDTPQEGIIVDDGRRGVAALEDGASDGIERVDALREGREERAHEVGQLPGAVGDHQMQVIGHLNDGVNEDLGKSSLRAGQVKTDEFATLGIGAKSEGRPHAPRGDEPAGSGLLATWSTHPCTLSKDDAPA